jgi:hypothetical protein
MTICDANSKHTPKKMMAVGQEGDLQLLAYIKI